MTLTLPSVIPLRDYQAQGVADIARAMRVCQRILYCLPTGAGKTITFCHIAARAAVKGNRVLILVHRAELLNQTSRSLTKSGVPHGLIAAKRSANLGPAVQVASVQTITRRLDRFPPDHFQLIIVDEAHHSNAKTFSRVLEHFERARVLGVTATPCRADGRGLGELYGDLVMGPSPRWLTENGFLAAAKVFCPPVGLDTSGLATRMGDFDLSGFDEQARNLQVMGDAVEHFRRYVGGGTAIVFCTSVAHAEEQAGVYQRAGIPAASIDGTMDDATRRRLLDDLGEGRIRVLTSCQLIGEGVDVPSVTACQFLRPTKSVALHLQMIGRALRPSPGKDHAIILDHVGNYIRPGLGHHLQDREWTLEGRKKSDKPTSPSVKECPRCEAAMFSTARACPECGHRFEVRERVVEVVDGQLREVTEEELERRRLRKEQGLCQTFDDLVAFGLRTGKKNPAGWADHVLRARRSR